MSPTPACDSAADWARQAALLLSAMWVVSHDASSFKCEVANSPLHAPSCWMRFRECKPCMDSEAWDCRKYSLPPAYILDIIVPPFAYPNTKPPRLQWSTRLRVTKSLAAPMTRGIRLSFEGQMTSSRRLRCWSLAARGMAGQGSPTRILINKKPGQARALLVGQWQKPEKQNPQHLALSIFLWSCLFPL